MSSNVRLDSSQCREKFVDIFLFCVLVPDYFVRLRQSSTQIVQSACHALDALQKGSTVSQALSQSRTPQRLKRLNYQRGIDIYNSFVTHVSRNKLVPLLSKIVKKCACVLSNLTPMFCALK